MNFTKSLLTGLISFLLLFTIIAQPAITQDGVVGFNWRHTGFDDSNTSFSPQTALNKNNINELRQDWMTSLSKEPKIFGNETARTTSSLLMVSGFIFMIDRSQLLLALNAEDSRLMWSEVLSVPDPERYGIEGMYVHSRLINYFDSKVWLIDFDCSIKGYGGYNGAIEVEIPPQVLCGFIPPEAKPRDAIYRTISAPVYYEEENIIIAAPSGFETEDSSLSYVVGISLDTQNIVWKTSLVIDARDNLNLGLGPWSVDQETGVVYIGTGSPIPEWNASNRPGDNLYSDSILALDASSGEILWHYQTNPHDINGYGCTNNILLGEIDGRKAVYAACRNGYLYALDASTGDLLWYFDPPAVKRMNSENADFVKTGSYDSEKPWLNYPSTDPAVQCPGIFGAAPFNIALGYDTIYMATFNSCSRLTVASVEKIGDRGVQNLPDLFEPVGPVNSTLYAVDASTGDVKWSQFFDGVAIKGGITVSGGLVYLPVPNGNLYALDAETGAQVWDRYFGNLGLAIPPVIGATARGNWTLVQVVAGTPLLEEALEQRSGFMFVFVLPSGAVTTTFEDPSSSTPDLSVATYAAVITAIILLMAALFLYNARRRKK